MDVLVTGADQRQGLAVIRSLGRRGLSVVAAGPSEDSIGFSSRYASERWVYPHAYDDPKEFISSLISAIRTFNVKVLFPVVESTLVIVNAHREMVEKETSIAAASREAVDLSFDKDRQFQIAQRIGIRIPKTITPSSISEARDLGGTLQFPITIKASVKPQGGEELGDAFHVSYFDSWEPLEKRLAIYYREGVTPIIQEMVLGDGIGFGLLMDHARPLCAYQYHRGRENHPTGGVPVRYESMPIWPEVMDSSVRLLQEMGWHGIAQVEWKNIRGTREMVLMEVNGRFWASLPGAIHAGMDFPAWLYDLWRGDQVKCPKSYKVPIACRYLSGDLKRLEILLRDPVPISSVPLGSIPSELWSFFADFFRWRVKSDIHSWDDIRPGMIEGFRLLSGLLNRIMKKFFKYPRK